MLSGFRRRFLGMIVVGLGVVFFSAVGEAARVQATVDRNTVELGSFVQLSLTVEGISSAAAPDLPDLPGFQVRYSHNSIQWRSINGRASQAIVFVYHLYPEKTGDFTIPAFTVQFEGQSFQTDPITIHVVDGGRPASGQGRSVSLKEKLFAVLSLSKDKVFWREPVTVTIKLYSQGLSTRPTDYPDLPEQGFIAGDYGQAAQYEQVIGGLVYTVVEFSKTIVPTRTGDLKVGPATIVTQVRLPQQRRQTATFFDDDFFDQLFNRVQVRQMKITSNDATLHVDPLPEPVPSGFSGAVGRFDFQVEVSPREVAVGDPITVRMTLSGDGSREGVTMPAFQANDDFKVYDPQVNDNRGRKVLEQVIIPKQEGVKAVPAVSFVYFDPAVKQYRTITRGPFPITVKPAQGGRGLSVVGATSPTVEAVSAVPEVLGEDIAFIKERPGSFRAREAATASSVRFVAACVLIGLIGAAGAGWLAYTRRLKTDVRLARRWHAPRYARKGLARARQALSREDRTTFYDELFQTVKIYFSHKFHVPPGAVTCEAVENRLSGSDLAPRFRRLWEHCEQVRFASVSLDTDQMAEDLRTAEEVIDTCERRA